MKKFTILTFLAVIFINCFVFYPSVDVPAKVDQIVFLAETAEIDGLFDIIQYSYSYCRTRILKQGDSILFRPILYFVLSVEKWLWGYNFVYWQITSLIFHMVTAGLLLRLLNRIKPHVISLAFVLFFSVIYANSNMVAWHHMHGYLLAIIFLLLALTDFLDYLRSQMLDRRALRRLIFWLLLACFTNEFCLIANILIFAVVWQKQKNVTGQKGSYSWLLAPIGIYALVSGADYWVHFSQGSFMSGLGSSSLIANIVVGLGLLLTIFEVSIILPIAPGFFHVVAQDPTAKNYGVFLRPQALSQLNPFDQLAFFLNSALGLYLCASLVLLALGIIKNRNRSKALTNDEQQAVSNLKTMVILSASLLIGYLVMITLFRSSFRSTGYLFENLYHFYFSSVFIVIGGYCLFHWIYLVKAEVRKQLFVSAVLILCLGAYINGAKTYRLNVEEKKITHGWGKEIRLLDTFVKEHKGEERFSFVVIKREYPLAVKIGIGKPPHKEFMEGKASDILFRKYIDAKNPKYYLVLEDNKLQSFRSSAESKKTLIK